MVDLVAVRTDGFGQRLKVILQAMRLASESRLGMKFVWDEKKGVNGNFHSCGDVNEIFSRDFVNKHYVRQKPPTVSWRRGLDLSNITTDLSLSRYDAPAGDCYREEFYSIGFSAGMQSAIDRASQPDVERASAIHLRGGDILYGGLRRHAFTHQEKVIPLPVAKRLVEAGHNNRWVVFAQDASLEDELRSYPNVVISSDLRSDLVTNAEKTIFDIVLMSRCSEVYGGTSAVCDVGSVISGKAPIRLGDVLSDKSVYSQISHDPKYKSGGYDKFLMASLKTSLFYYSDRRAADIGLLVEGASLDPGNLSFNVLRFFALCSSGVMADAEDLAAEALTSKAARSWLELIKVFMSRPAIRQRVLPCAPENLSSKEFPHSRLILEFAKACSAGSIELVESMEGAARSEPGAIVTRMYGLLAETCTR